MRIDFGQYQGRCIDSCRFRHAEPLPSAAAPHYGADRAHVVIANFRHKAEYWIARIPVDTVENVDILFQNFFYGVNHTALRFRFGSEGVHLFVQNSAQKKAPAEAIPDLVLSIEGVTAKDEKYDVFNSSLGNYLVDYRVQSGAETADWMVGHHRHSVRQYRLHMPAAEMRALLLRGLMASEHDSFKSRYRLVFHNCATTILDLLGDAPAGGLNWWLRLPRGWPLLPANGTLRALRERGLISPGEASRIEDLAIEPETF